MNRNIIYSGTAGFLSGVISYYLLANRILSTLIDWVFFTDGVNLDLMLLAFEYLPYLLFGLAMATIFWKIGIKRTRIFKWVIIATLSNAISFFIVGVFLASLGDFFYYIFRYLLISFILSVGIFTATSMQIYGKKSFYKREFLYTVILGFLLFFLPAFASFWVRNISNDFTQFLGYVIWPTGLAIRIGYLIKNRSSHSIIDSLNKFLD